MTSALLLTLLLGLASEPALELSFERVEGRTLLHLRGLPEPDAVQLTRDGAEIVLSLPGAAAGLSVPAAQAPVEDLRLRSVSGQVELRLRLQDGWGFELKREAAQVSLAFAPKAKQEFPELYRSLFPAGLHGEPGSSGLGAPLPEETESEEGRGDGALAFGPLTLRPALLVSYVDGEFTLENAAPVHDRYFQIEPRLGLLATLQLAGGRLRLSYEPTFRRRSTFALTSRPSHEADGDLRLPVGAALTLRGNVHYTLATLETGEVDPGREYFFDLGQFHRWRYGAGVRFETGGRFDVDVTGSLNRVRFDEPAYFYDFDERALLAELGYDLTPSVRMGLGYTYGDVPAESVRQHPQAASTSHGVRLSLAGAVGAFNGELYAAYDTREHPRAGVGGQRYSGLLAGLRVLRELNPGTAVSLELSRNTTLSAFEDNGFYLSNLGALSLTLPVPLGFSAHGSVGLQLNSYNLPAGALGVPRRDTLRGWSAGLGRALTRWAYLRADYRAERRDSNLNEFDNRTHTFVAQIGVGWLGSRNAADTGQ